MQSIHLKQFQRSKRYTKKTSKEINEIPKENKAPTRPTDVQSSTRSTALYLDGTAAELAKFSPLPLSFYHLGQAHRSQTYHEILNHSSL
jgi:hypothetical protein